MLDMSWGEILVIGAVALIVIGPKDLPKALRTVGQMTTKVRRMAGEFQSQFSEAMRDAELEETRQQLQGLNQSVASATSMGFNPMQTIRDELKTSIETPLPDRRVPEPASASELGPASEDLLPPPAPMGTVGVAPEPLPEVSPALAEPASEPAGPGQKA